MKQVLKQVEQRCDQSEVLQAVKKVKTEADGRSVADAVFERISRAGSLKVDNSEVLQAINGRSLADAVFERISRPGSLKVDNSEVLQAIRRAGPDHEAVASAVLDKFTSSKLADQSAVLHAIKAVEMHVVQTRDSVSKLDHAPVLEAVGKISLPDPEKFVGAFHDKIRNHKFDVDHSEVLRAIKSSEVSLDPIHEALGRINVVVDHTPVIEAIRTYNTSDLAASLNSLHEKLRKNNSSGDVGEVLMAIKSLELNLSSIREALVHFKPNVDHTPVLDAMQRLRSPDSQAIASAVCDDIRKVNLTFDNSEVLGAIRKLRAEVDVGHVVAAIENSQAIIRELRGVPQGLSEMKQVLKQVEQRCDQSEVLQAVKKVKTEADGRSVADAVFERISRAGSLKVDNSEVLQAINGRSLADAVFERISRPGSLKVDNSEVLQAIRRAGPDHEAVASAVLDKFTSSKLADQSAVLHAIKAVEMHVVQTRDSVSKLDHAPVLEAVGKISLPDPEKFVGAFHDKIRNHKFDVDHSEVLRAIKSSEVSLDPIHEALGRINVVVDHTPVIEAIRTYNTSDLAASLNSLHEKLRKNNSSGDSGEVLTAIKSLELNMSSVREALVHFKPNVDHAPVLDAVRRLRPPDSQAIASAVRDDIRKINFTFDNSEVMGAIQNLRAEVDFGHVVAAIENSRADMAALNATLSQAVSTMGSALVDAIRQLSIPDARTIAEVLHEKLRRDTFSAHNSEVVQEIRRIRSAPADLDTASLHEAIATLNSVAVSLQMDLARFIETAETRPFRVAPDLTATMPHMHRTLSDTITVRPVPQAQMNAAASKIQAHRRGLEVRRQHQEKVRVRAQSAESPRAQLVQPAGSMQLPLGGGGAGVVLEQQLRQSASSVALAVPSQRVVQALHSWAPGQTTPRSIAIPSLVPAPVGSVDTAPPTPTISFLRGASASQPVVQAIASPVISTLASPAVLQVGTAVAVSAGSTCAFCGNTFMDDSNYCRKCGKHRAGADLGVTAGAGAAAGAATPPQGAAGTDTTDLDFGASSAANLGLAAGAYGASYSAVAPGTAQWMTTLRNDGPNRSRSTPRLLSSVVATPAERPPAAAGEAPRAPSPLQQLQGSLSPPLPREDTLVGVQVRQYSGSVSVGAGSMASEAQLVQPVGSMQLPLGGGGAGVVLEEYTSPLDQRRVPQAAATERGGSGGWFLQRW